jgi:hypothetical protein
MFEEFETDTEQEPGEFEFEGAEEFQQESDQESPLGEVEEMELAAELLEVSDEQELDQFLGKLISKAAGAASGLAGAARGFLRSPTGQALGGLLKSTAKKALPIIGRGVGTYFGGERGGTVGSTLGKAAGQMFGLELEGLSGEDQEFEVARQFVRLAGSATQKAAQSGSRTPQAARAALASAARQHAPGLLSPSALSGGISSTYGGGHARSGRWIRRGRKLIVFGV